MPTLTELSRRLKPAHRQRAARLPRVILVTDAVRLPNPLPVAHTLPRGSAIILRHPDATARTLLAAMLRPVCRQRRLILIVAGDWRLAACADGLHLPEAVLRRGSRRWRLQRRPGWLVTAAAHSPGALRRALAAGVDAVLLSPVFATASHPGASGLGVLRFAAWVRCIPLPVYALGGVSAVTSRRLAGSGAAGLAAIGALSG